MTRLDTKNNEKKPQKRWQSPVFWASLIAQAMSILVLTGVISDGESEALKAVACAVLQGLVTFGILNDPTNGAAF